MIKKPFSKELYEQNDEIGIQIVIHFLKKKGIRAIKNPNKYAVDLIIYKEQKIGYGEVEVRHSWDSEKFKYNTLNIPLRKKKLLENDLTTYLFAINKNKTKMYVIKDDAILASPIEENKNKYIKEKEYFYKVDLVNCKLYDLMEEDEQ
jgi:hypothetical protein